MTPFLGGCSATMTPKVDTTKRAEAMTALILLRRRLSRSDSGLRRRAGSTRRGGGWKRNGGALRKKCAVAAEALRGKAWTSPAQITPRALRLKAPPVWLEAEGARRSAATMGSITAAATASSSESSINSPSPRGCKSRPSAVEMRPLGARGTARSR